MPPTANDSNDSNSILGAGRPLQPRPLTHQPPPVGTPAPSRLPAPVATSSADRAPSRSSPNARWNEPPLAQPKASYKEYDDKAFMNTSTIHMQPLGEMPSAKMLEATKRPFPHQTKKKGKAASASLTPKANGTGTSLDSISAGGSLSGGIGGSLGMLGGVGGEGGGFGVIGGGGLGVRSAFSSVGADFEGGESNVRTPAIPVAQPIQRSPAGPAAHTPAPQTPLTQTPAPQTSAPQTPAPQTPGQASVTKPATPTTATGTTGTSVRTSGSPTATANAPSGPRNPPAATAWMNGQTPSSKTEQGRARLSMVVEAAIQRSSLVGNVDLGRAIKKLYDESLENNELADLLDAVLAQNAKPSQIFQFQTYVRYARENPDARVTGRDKPRPEPPLASTPAPVTRMMETPTVEAVKVEPSESGTTLNGSTPTTVAANDRKVAEERMDKQYGDAHSTTAGDSDSEMMSVSSEMVNMSSIRSSQQRHLADDMRDSDSERPEKRVKLPEYDALKQDSNIRDPPPLPTRTRGRKRQRSPGMTSPAPAVDSGPPSSTSSYTAPTVPQSSHPHQPPPKKKNKSNKVKISPAKKALQLENLVVTAGIGEGVDQRRPRYGSEEVSENEDVCAVCNGQGRFLCCDRCPRSFHFSCLNPPLEDSPEGMWFCNKCTSQTSPPPKEPRGLFADLLNNVKTQNPTSFRLPVHIRTYFVGVETGPLGEYVDTRDTKTQKYSKSGFLEEYDTRKLKDKHGNTLLCHDCGKSAVDGQRIISCDYCPLSWHLDCIRPMPMSNPPSSQKKWMCPAHVDWILQRRRPKKAPVVDTYLRRGHRNNGLIEIENEPEEQFEKIEMNGVVYRLPERGIKLDFLDKVKTTRRQEENKRQSLLQIQPAQPTQRSASSPPATLPSEHPSTAPETPPELKERSVVDRQLVDSLLLLRSSSPPVSTLTETDVLRNLGLLAEAASDDVAALLRPDVETEAADPKLLEQQLLALQELISRQLQLLTGASSKVEGSTQAEKGQQTDPIPQTEHLQQTDPVEQAEKTQQTEPEAKPETGPEADPEAGHKTVPEAEPNPEPLSTPIYQGVPGLQHAVAEPRIQYQPPPMQFQQEAPVALMAPVAPMASMGSIAPMAPMAYMGPPPDLSAKEVEDLMDFPTHDN